MNPNYIALAQHEVNYAVALATSVWFPDWVRVPVLLILATLLFLAALQRVRWADGFRIHHSRRTLIVLALSYPWTVVLVLAWQLFIERQAMEFDWSRSTVFAATIASASIYFTFGVTARAVDVDRGPLAAVDVHVVPVARATIVFTLVFIFLSSGNTLSSASGWMQGSAILGVAAATGAMGLASQFAFDYLQMRDTRRTTAWRNREADRITADVCANRPTQPFALYLRSFEVTDRLLVGQPYSFVMDEDPDALAALVWDAPVPSRTHWNPHIDFELILYAAWGDALPTIKLGPPITGPGVGGIQEQANDEWKDLFIQLVEAATWVILVPGSTPGVQWELAWLQDHNHFDRTVHVMLPHIDVPAVLPGRPANRLLPASERARSVDLRTEWAKARKASQGRGLSLPAYDETGALLMFNSSGHVLKRSGPLGFLSARHPVAVFAERLHEVAITPHSAIG